MMYNELRIGNYIKDSKNRILKVDGIKIDETVGFEIDAWPIKGGGIVSLPYLKIPLTEQWLLDFGFEKLETSFYKKHYSKKYYLLVSVKQGYIEICVNGICGGQAKCEYVHQLQNLYFALTGEELKRKEGR